MPRNPDKRRCQTPRCGNWAMRGRTHYLSHLDHLLGPLGAGAPDGNLNALKSGDYAHPLSERVIMDLAHALVQRPDQLKTKLTQVINQLYRRSGPIPSDLRTLKTLVSLEIVLKSLISHFANDLFVMELEALTNNFSPATQAEYKSRLWKAALPRWTNGRNQKSCGTKLS